MLMWLRVFIKICYNFISYITLSYKIITKVKLLAGRKKNILMHVKEQKLKKKTRKKWSAN